MEKKITPATIKKMKGKEKICMLTAYDFPLAHLLEAAGVDILLVGDSLGNVILGYENTLPVTVSDMVHHAGAVRRGAPNAFLVIDSPAKTFRGNAFLNAQKLVKKGLADAIKIEGMVHLNLIKKLVQSNIPVMGHLGYTPQLIRNPSIQGKTAEIAASLLENARQLEAAGVFALVLELVDPRAAADITAALKIPTISCGSGPACDGQVLVTHDLVGLYPKKVPKFVKPYADLGTLFKKAVVKYIADVKAT